MTPGCSRAFKKVSFQKRSPCKKIDDIRREYRAIERMLEQKIAETSTDNLQHAIKKISFFEGKEAGMSSTFRFKISHLSRFETLVFCKVMSSARV